MELAHDKSKKGEMTMFIHWLIIITVAVVSLIGIIGIARRSPFHYGILLVLQLVSAFVLCVFFQKVMGFYRFALPLRYAMILVLSGFGLYVLFIVHYRPRHKTFFFLFTVLHLVFILEYILEQYVHFIVYQNGWDTWDSYTWYWIYTIVFAGIGDYVVPEKYRNPVDPYSKGYWLSFFGVLVLTVAFTVYVLQAGT
ncbi:hypothetical protein [Ectobacillus ponti]|uniref:Uncharacterized protein n=1 Tax=Ectobacillus ponti TaxID=2961894 RepID=A0AA41X8I1_9BACI|nr:hypothetical protein [Ectobacillus ponti]MCP8968325.1 hypothetical protein [Ectobacillus ponti]